MIASLLGQNKPPSCDQQGACLVPASSLERQVRCQIAQLPRQPRVSRLQGRERAGGEGDPPGRQQLGGDRLPGQHVPEPENIILDGQQLPTDTMLQRTGVEVGV